MLKLSWTVLFSLTTVAALGCSSTPEPTTGTVATGEALSVNPSAQMQAIVTTARAAAEGVRPKGQCYAAVARYIDTVGYGKMTAQSLGRIGSLPAIPDAFGAYAHQFADYANEPGHLALLGLTRLAVDNPYDAPTGAIVVVRAGTPGTAHPTTGDISIAAGGGVFFNDGEMSYGGSSRFPAGNDYVLGIYVPAGSGRTCTQDEECNGGQSHRGEVCGNDAMCISGCHSDGDCADGTTCDTSLPHWACR